MNTDIRKLVNEFPSESEYGLTNSEIEQIISQLPVTFNRDRYNRSMDGHTCMMNDRGEIINYHCDIIQGLYAAFRF